LTYTSPSPQQNRDGRGAINPGIKYQDIKLATLVLLDEISNNFREFKQQLDSKWFLCMACGSSLLHTDHLMRS